MGRPSVFISYRRRLSEALALYISKDLTEHRFDTFVDSENLDSGEFERKILSEIEACNHFIVLLEPGSLDQIGEDGDWLRREIAHALAHGRNVVPVTANGFDFRRDLVLPQDVARLASFNAVAMHSGYYREAMKRLRKRFLKTLPEPAAPPIPETRSVVEEEDRQALARSGTLTSAGTPGIRPPHLAIPKLDDSLMKIPKTAGPAPKARPMPKLKDIFPTALEAPTVEKTDEQIEREEDATRASVAEAQAERETRAQAPQLDRPKIFLCYRREDTQGFARGIYESLAGKYGHEQIFRDIDFAPSEVRYSTWIETKVGQCSVMVVLIGDAWLSAIDRAGQRRLDSPTDWVRQEIEAALGRDIPIIPVRIQGATMPPEDELPSSIAELAGFHSAMVTDSRWDFDVGLLMQAIDNLVASD